VVLVRARLLDLRRLGATARVRVRLRATARARVRATVRV